MGYHERGLLLKCSEELWRLQPIIRWLQPHIWLSWQHINSVIIYMIVSVDRTYFFYAKLVKKNMKNYLEVKWKNKTPIMHVPARQSMYKAAPFDVKYKQNTDWFFSRNTGALVTKGGSIREMCGLSDSLTHNAFARRTRVHLLRTPPIQLISTTQSGKIIP